MKVIKCDKNKARIELTEQEINFISAGLEKFNESYVDIRNLSLDFLALLKLIGEQK